jgi:hypothetical protein
MDDALLEYGHEAERAVDKWLRKQGESFLALHQFKKLESSPKISTPARDEASPDFICWSNVCRLVEVKRWKWFERWDDEARRAIWLPKWMVDGYRRTSAATATPLLLYFVPNTSPFGIFEAPLESMNREHDDRFEFLYSRMTQLASREELLAADPEFDPTKPAPSS